MPNIKRSKMNQQINFKNPLLVSVFMKINEGLNICGSDYIIHFTLSISSTLKEVKTSSSFTKN